MYNVLMWIFQIKDFDGMFGDIVLQCCDYMLDFWIVQCVVVVGWGVMVDDCKGQFGVGYWQIMICEFGEGVM